MSENRSTPPFGAPLTKRLRRIPLHLGASIVTYLMFLGFWAISSERGVAAFDTFHPNLAAWVVGANLVVWGLIDHFAKAKA